MESMMQLAIALCCAAGAISLFAILRRTMNSPSAPALLSHVVTAQGIALLLTGAFASSLAYVAYSLLPFMPAGLAFLATFIIHGGLYALCAKLVPVSASQAPARSFRMSDAAAQPAA